MKISGFLNKDNNNLDLIRIVLACLVIVGHSSVLNGSANYSIDPIEYFSGFTYSGAFAVKLFFFISGLVVTNSYLHKQNATYFIISRFFRIMPALLFVLLITVFVFGLLVTKLNAYDYFSQLNYFAYLRHNVVFYSDYLLPGVFDDNFYPNIVNGSLWSLRYEVGCYFVLLVAFLLLGNRNKYYFIIPILLIFLNTLIPSRFLLGFLDYNSEKFLLPMSFAYGVLLAIISDKISINIYVIILSILSFLFFKETEYKEIVFLLSSCNIIIYLSSLKFILRFKPKYDISYGIYLWGFLIQQMVFHYFGVLNILLHCLIAIILSSILGLITFLYVEKPFIKIGKSVIGYTSKI